MIFLILKKKFLDMNNNYTELEIKQILENSKKCSFIVEINNGEINIITSGQRQPFIILNKDSKQFMMKNIKDCFMDLHGILKTEVEKWKE